MTMNVIARNMEDKKCLFYGMSDVSLDNLKNKESFQIKPYDTSDPCLLEENSLIDLTLVEGEYSGDNFIGYIQTNVPKFKITTKNLNGSIDGVAISSFSTMKIPASSGEKPIVEE